MSRKRTSGLIKHAMGIATGARPVALSNPRYVLP